MAQMEEHAAFVSWLLSTEKFFHESSMSHADVANAVSNHLEDWLANHILVSDKAYKEYLT